MGEVLTVVSSVAGLSQASGSNQAEVVLAVLEMFVVREELFFSSRVRHSWSERVWSAGVCPSDLAVRVPPPVAETKLVPAGIASDRLTPVASDGPLFVT